VRSIPLSSKRRHIVSRWRGPSEAHPNQVGRGSG
jgi:hypothetical protein